MREPRFVTHVWTVVWGGYLLAVAVLSLMPVAIPQTVAHGDKLMHFLAYAGLAALWPRHLATGARAVLWAAAVGVALEAGQGVVPTGRFPDAWDALANAGGATLGASLTWLGGKWRGSPVVGVGGRR